MNSTYKYFFWAMPTKDKELYALYDCFDNHFMLQSYDYEILFAIRTLFRSKTTLEILRLTQVENLVEKNLLDNSVIEHWGTDNTDFDFYGDLALGWQGHTKSDAYHNRIEHKKIILKQASIKFDSFKQDLQQQLFFAHYCLGHNPNELVLSHLNSAVGLGHDCVDVIDKFLDLTTVADQKQLYELLNFLKISRLIYE